MMRMMMWLCAVVMALDVHAMNVYKKLKLVPIVEEGTLSFTSCKGDECLGREKEMMVEMVEISYFTGSTIGRGVSVLRVYGEIPRVPITSLKMGVVYQFVITRVNKWMGVVFVIRADMDELVFSEGLAKTIEVWRDLNEVKDSGDDHVRR